MGIFDGLWGHRLLQSAVRLAQLLMGRQSFRRNVQLARSFVSLSRAMLILFPCVIVPPLPMQVYRPRTLGWESMSSKPPKAGIQDFMGRRIVSSFEHAFGK